MRKVRPLWIGIYVSAALVAVPLLVATTVSGTAGLTFYDGTLYSTERISLTPPQNGTGGSQVSDSYRGVSFQLDLEDWGSPGGPVVTGQVTEPGSVTLVFSVGGPSSCACWASADGYVGVQYDSNLHVLLMVATMAPVLLGWTGTVPLVVGTVGLVTGLVLVVKDSRSRRRRSSLTQAGNSAETAKTGSSGSL